jgi:hypothetical protein
VFLTRRYTKNPNKDARPVHYWSNVTSLSYMLNKEDERNDLHLELGKVAPLLWKDPSREVFGTQELRPIGKNNGKSIDVDHYDHANDQAFFQSICTLMKAQAYEVDRLADRQVKQRIYVFSLLSVMDGELIEVDYDNRTPEAHDVDNQPYIAHYIIHKREQFSRINFVSIDALDKTIEQYGAAHTKMVSHLEKCEARFYSSSMADNSIRRHLLPAFARWARAYLQVYAPNFGKIDENDIELYFEGDVAKIAVLTNVDDNVFVSANADEKLNHVLARYLKKIYRYDGEFTIVREIPF